MRNRTLLGEFLRARREATSPEDVGMPQAGRRRTPGLRREEVAVLAGVSTDYYVRLEQGRDRCPSEQVLAAIARALHLDAAATEYMSALAHPSPRRPGRRVEKASPRLLRMLNNWDHGPAFIVGRRQDVLAANALADALYTGLEHRDNLLRLAFLNPKSRVFYPNWESSASDKVARLRAAVADDPADPALLGLVEELSRKSRDFRRMWARHNVLRYGTGQRQFHHRAVGDLTLCYESFTINSAPGQQLIIFEAEPGSPAEEALRRLAELVRRRSGDAWRPRQSFGRRATARRRRSPVV